MAFLTNKENRFLWVQEDLKFWKRLQKSMYFLNLQNVNFVLHVT